MPKDQRNQLPARQGHFRLESGHHGNLWLDLDALLLRPTRLQPLVVELAQRLAGHNIEAVCGPLVGGAFVAQMVAAELDIEFFYAERMTPAPSDNDKLYSVNYQIPHSLRSSITRKTVAIVDDAITVGSAVRATFADVQACDAQIVAIGALVFCREPMTTFAAEQHIPLESIVQFASDIWIPSACPLCAIGVPLEDLGSSSQ